MNKYICIEIGISAYTEFLMKNNEFKETSDGIFLGIVEALNNKEAIEKIKLLEENKNRLFDNIIAYELK